MEELYKKYLDYVKKKADILWMKFNREMEFARKTKEEYQDFDCEIAELEAWERIGKRLQDIEIEATYRGCNVNDVKILVWEAR